MNSAAVVAVMWHWNAPSGLLNTTYTNSDGRVVDASWYRGFYTDATTFDLSLAMADPSSEEYGLILRDIDAIAAQLERLDTAGVPVLWRPLHEAAGGWFWWGAHGPEPYLKLWNLLFDRLTNYHGLTNLIWVWNGEHADWYPGDATVDIVSTDIYAADRDYSPQLASFGAATYYASSPKIVALSENGVLLDPEALVAERRGLELVLSVVGRRLREQPRPQRAVHAASGVRQRSRRDPGRAPQSEHLSAAVAGSSLRAC